MTAVRPGRAAAGRAASGGEGATALLASRLAELAEEVQARATQGREPDGGAAGGSAP